MGIIVRSEDEKSRRHVLRFKGIFINIKSLFHLESYCKVIQHTAESLFESISSDTIREAVKSSVKLPLPPTILVINTDFNSCIISGAFLTTLGSYFSH